MKKKVNRLKRVGLALAGLGAIASSSAFAAMQIDTHGGLRVWDPCNSSYWFLLNGRLEFDEIYFSAPYRDRRSNFPSSANIRRAFLAFQGGIGECLTYNLTLDFGRSFANWVNTINPNDAEFANRGQLLNRNPFLHGHTLVEEAWLGYTGLWECTRIRLGQFTPLTTMDGLSNYGTGNGQMFLESALATRAFSVPSYLDSDSRAMKGLGVIVETQICDVVTLAGTIYQPAHGSLNVYGDARASDRLGGAIRGTFSPIHEDGCVFHLGAMGRYQTLNSTDGTQRFGTTAIRNTLFFTTPEVTPRNYVGNPRNVSAVTTNDPNLLNIGAQRVKSYATASVEALGIWGPITLQGEGHYAQINRLADGSAADPDVNTRTLSDRRWFYGWHLQGGYVLTGESRCYDFANGGLCGIKPCNPYGAWEVVARYSRLHLNNKDIWGGSEHNVTVGLNWYANDNVRVAFNYIRANILPTGTRAGTKDNTVVNRHLDIFGARLQVVF